MAKATYMYWQKRFNRENPDQDLEEKIQKIQEKNKNYGYRRIFGELRKQGLVVNKKKVQRIMKKLGLQVTSFTRKSRTRLDESSGISAHPLGCIKMRSSRKLLR